LIGKAFNAFPIFSSGILGKGAAPTREGLGQVVNQQEKPKKFQPGTAEKGARNRWTGTKIPNKQGKYYGECYTESQLTIVGSVSTHNRVKFLDPWVGIQ
jgi:hypothetical protein